MEADLKKILVDVNPQVAVIAIVIFFKDQLLCLQRRVIFEIINIRSRMRLHGSLALSRTNQGVDVVTAVPADDEGDIIILPIKLHDARVALHVVSVCREEGMRIDALLFANGVDLAKHGRAVSVISTRTAVLCGW